MHINANQTSFIQKHIMGLSSYFKGKKGLIFWINILLMLTLLIGIPVGAFFLLDVFTHHGETVEVPNVRDMSLARAKSLLTRKGFVVVVSDSIETEEVRPGAVYEQLPKAGSEVKTGRIIYLVTRYQNEALVEIPKLVGEHSYRESKIILSNLGFRFTPDSIVEGMEEGLLIGVYQGRKRLYTGDKVAKVKPLTLYVGGGIIDSIEVDTITKEIEIDPDFIE